MQTKITFKSIIWNCAKILHRRNRTIYEIFGNVLRCDTYILNCERD